MKALHWMLFFALFVLSCNQDGCQSGSSDRAPETLISYAPPVGQGADVAAVVAQRKGVLPNVCALVPVGEIARVLQLDPGSIKISDSTPKEADPAQTNCFFLWDDPAFPNAGILLRAAKNSVGSEYPDYVTMYIDFKKSAGENSIDGEKFLFKDFSNLGDDGAYNFDSGKYYWRLGNEIIFMIAFNSPHSEAEQFNIASQIGKMMTENYLNGR